MKKECVNCPGAEDHSTAQCPLVSAQKAGSAEEEVEVVAWRYRHSEQEKWQAGVERKSLWETEPLMTVSQHERIVAALSAQQSAPDRVSVQVKLLRGISFWLERTNEKSDEDIAELIELRALLTSHGRGEA